MKASVRRIGNAAVVDLTGRMVIGGGDVLLREAITQLFEQKVPRIVLNLAKVSYMDSASIGELVACYKRSLAVDSRVKLIRPPSKVSSLLETTRFDELFETYDTEEEALASFIGSD